MKNEEAIRILKNSAFLATVSKYQDIEEAVEMAINALGAIEQIQWERDLAIKQLHDLGYGLGEKTREDNSSSDKLIKASDAVDIVAKHSALYGNGEITTDEGEALLYDIMSEIMNLPSAQSEPVTNCHDLTAAIEAIERIFDRCEEIEAHLPEGDPDRVGYKMYPDWLTVWKYLHQVPSAQPDVPDTNVGDMSRRFVELLAEYHDPEICPYKEYKGKPYFIKYIENGEGYVGYGTYSPKVMSQYLREYFMATAQSERKTGRWIYNSPVTMRCDQCGYVVKDWEWSRANYCAGCGIPMRKGGEG